MKTKQNQENQVKSYSQKEQETTDGARWCFLGGSRASSVLISPFTDQGDRNYLIEVYKEEEELVSRCSLRKGAERRIGECMRK